MLLKRLSRKSAANRLASLSVCFCAVLAMGASAGAWAGACEQLSRLALTDTTVTSAGILGEGMVQEPGVPLPPRAVPERCEVKGVIKPSADSEIAFVVWLPTRGWNGKFEGVGNGGYAGSINYSTGIAPAVARGYATVSTDTGHSGTAIEASWAKGHPQKVIDFGYRAIHLATLAAKAITTAYYTKAPTHSYFASCSNGGRQALMEAQRYPEDYDGILAGAPANDWTGLFAASFAWNAQALAAAPIAPERAGLIQKAVDQQCVAQDDGGPKYVRDPRTCHFDPRVLRCKSAGGEDCLSEAQVVALEKIYEGPHMASGAAVFPGFSPSGSEQSTVLAASGWDGWIFGAKPGASLQAIYATSFMHDFAGEESWSVERNNVDRDYASIRAAFAATLNATDPDLRRFVARGGKLIMYHGWADPAIPPLNSIDYFRKVLATTAAAGDSVELFMVPGMQHCVGGNGPSDFGQLGPGAESPPRPASDLSAALERWVETGARPESIVATQMDTLSAAMDSSKNSSVRTALLCPYPQVAIWNGRGSKSSAKSYRCGHMAQ